MTYNAESGIVLTRGRAIAELSPPWNERLMTDSMKPSYPTHRFGTSQALSVFSITFAGVAWVLVLAVLVSVPYCVIRPPRVSFSSARSAADLRASEQDFSLTLRIDGATLLGQMYVEPGHLRNELSQLALYRTDRSVVLRIDNRVAFGRVRHVVGALRDSGFAHARVVTFEGTPFDLLAH